MLQGWLDMYVKRSTPPTDRRMWLYAGRQHVCSVRVKEGPGKGQMCLKFGRGLNGQNCKHGVVFAVLSQCTGCCGMGLGLVVPPRMANGMCRNQSSALELIIRVEDGGIAYMCRETANASGVRGGA